MSGSKKTKTLAALGIGGLVILAVWGIFWKKKQTTALTYRQVTVSRGDLDVTILSTGIVEPENRLDIKPPIAGRAEEVLVDEGKLVKKGQLLLWMSSTERAGLLDAARARGPAELKRWEEFYKPTPVLAPIDGTIILRNVEPGQTFTNQDAVLVMSDRLTVQAQVDETDIAAIQLRQKTHIVLDAYPRENISARVEKIAYDAKTVNNVTTYIVDVLPEEIPSFMRSGMTANVTFDVKTKKDILILPSEAVKTKDGRTVVERASSGGRAKSEEVEVKTGITDGKRVEIVSGVSEGDVVLAPQFKIKDSAGSAGTNPFAPVGGGRRVH